MVKLPKEEKPDATGYGDATQLIAEGVDLGKVTALIDEVVANGGVVY